MTKLLIEQLDLNKRRLFLRADLNVPLEGETVSDDTRLTAVIPTIQHALKHGATVVLASHLGRPKGKRAPGYLLTPVAGRLTPLLGQPVPLAPDCVGAETEARALRPGEMPLLENLRFHAEEEANDDGFARQLAGLPDCCVNDAFAPGSREPSRDRVLRDHRSGPAPVGQGRRHRPGLRERRYSGRASISLRAIRSPR